MRLGTLALVLGIGILVATRKPGPASAHPPRLLAAASVPSGGPIQAITLGVDDHNADGTDSNANGILEPGETVQVSPFWKNNLGDAQAFTGLAATLSGPPGPAYTLVDSFADYGTVAAGATADCADATGDCYLVTVSGARPVPHWDVAFAETLSILGVSTKWTIHVGESFTDVPTTHPFYAYIEQLFHLEITGGCGPGLYCPENSVTRGQMAVFLEKAEHGSGFIPNPCRGIFGDVPCPSQFADWVEQLYNEGITGGCQTSPLLLYCPDNPVTRAQMAVFLLKTEHGFAYVPPPCTGIFADVPCPSQFADWIEQLSTEGITGGCGGNNYCPNSPVNRGQMAVFLLRTFAPLNPPVPTPTATPAATSTSTPTLTVTPSLTPTPTLTTSATLTPSPTIAVTPTTTNSPIPGTPTFTNTLTPTNTLTATPSPTPTSTPTTTLNHVVSVGAGGDMAFVDSVSGAFTSTITAGQTIEWD